MDFADKKVLVCGLARSGQAAAKLLAHLGAKVTVQDLKTEISWGYNPEEAGFSFHLGQEPDDIILPGAFDLIIISPGISIYAPFVEKAKSFGIPVWGETELASQLCPCPIIGITGTNGKTTVTTLVGEILKQHNPSTIIAGNIGIPLTELVLDLTPESIVVAEISSFQLETIADFCPAISAVLNMTEDHLDRHRTMENYIAMKSRIFENQGQNNICVLNYDNDITRAMTPPGKKLYFSAMYTPEESPDIGVYLQDGVILAWGAAGELPIPILPLAETRVMPENALAATALCIFAGVPLEKIADGLRAFRGVTHRLEYVAAINNIDFYNDSKATNVDAAVKALESFNRPVVLIAGGYDKNTDFAPWVSRFAGKVAHLILLGQTTEQIIQTCDAAGFSAYQRVDTLQEAVERAKELARPGQAVLFSPACASFDMFKDFEERGNLFKSYV